MKTTLPNKKFQPAFIIMLSMLVLLGGCRKADLEVDDESDDVIDRTDLPDWAEESHSSSVDPDYTLVFDHEDVLRFDIVVDPDDWSDMQDDLDANLGSSGSRPGGGPGGGTTTLDSDYTPIWVPCSVFFNDTEWYHVGIRYKGNSSLSSAYQSGIEKLSFKLDFDEFDDDYPEIEDQRFYGFRQFSLKNNYDDASLLREKVVSDLFREFGLVSSRTAFAVVYVDFGSGPEYFGVYTLVEEVDDTVLDSQFGSSDGNLYKPDGGAATFAAGSYDESELGFCNNRVTTDYLDVYSLYTEINSSARTTDTESWKVNVTSVFDVDVFMQWLAANTAMQNWDTYGNMTHNYYLYNDPITSQLTWIPWDNNEALQEGKLSGALSLSLSEVGSSWPLIKYLVDVDEYQQAYDNYLLEFSQDHFTTEKMTALYTQYYDLLKDYAYAESYPYTFINSDGNFDVAINELKEHVQSRNTAILSYLQ